MKYKTDIGLIYSHSKCIRCDHNLYPVINEIFLTFISCLCPHSCVISSNRESGEGRFDIQLEPKDKSQLGYIIEFKAGKNLSDTELADSASSAIQQIQSKKYSTDMEYHGIKKIGLFGIAFSGKRVAAKYAEIQLHS